MKQNNLEAAQNTNLKQGIMSDILCKVAEILQPLKGRNLRHIYKGHETWSLYYMYGTYANNMAVQGRLFWEQTGY